MKCHKQCVVFLFIQLNERLSLEIGYNKSMCIQKLMLQRVETTLNSWCSEFFISHFRWKKTGDCEWTGVFANRVWTLSQNDDYILYRVTKGHGLENDEKVQETPTKSTRFQTVARVKGNKTKKLMCAITNSEVDEIGDVTETKPKPDDNSLECDLLRKYFRLDVSLKQHYAQWARKDPHFEKAAEKFTGVRILCQDPVENLFSFICSSNNNIARFEI